MYSEKAHAVLCFNFFKNIYSNPVLTFAAYPTFLLPVIAHAYNWYLGRLDDLNEFLHSSSVFISSHTIHFIHN